ncbi:MAG: urease accessory protein UreF, partial [Alphaproteobacteria bacterium]|nr:urease accessory protein UreF [Alphaproteobacteria bacterium]
MGMSESGLCRLMIWLSPAFPVGAYSYSHGIEWAVEAGALRDRDGLADWVADVLRHGAGRIDAALFLAAHRAVTAGDEPALRHAI